MGSPWGSPRRHAAVRARVCSRGVLLNCTRCVVFISAAGGDDLGEVREYFNNVGFERWNKVIQAKLELNNCFCRKGQVVLSGCEVSSYYPHTRPACF